MRGGRRTAWIATATAIAAALAGLGVGIGVGRSGEAVTTVTQTVSTGTVATGSTEPATTAPETPTVGSTTAATSTTAQVAAEALPGVVSILATLEVQAPLPGQTQEAVSEGAGLVLDEKGHILTNEHVIEEATAIHVTFADGTKVHATVLGSDPFLDLAVLQVDVSASTLHPLTLGSADDLRVGDPVVAIGNPFGLERSVSAGVVSALRRQMTAPNGFTISNAVQTDAPINHGNSGGPLLDAEGRVIGVNAQIADSGVDANVGVGFAVAIDAEAKREIEQLLAGRTVQHAWLGVSLDDIDAILATSGRVQAAAGALITGVVSGGPGAEAGLRGGSEIVSIDGVDYCLGGDIITAVGDQPVTTTGDLQRMITAYEPDDEVTLSVERASGASTSVQVTLGTQPTTAPEATTGCG